MRPLISIVAPTLGRLELWKQALHSAILQDFTDFEIIAINSHPSDESAALIREIGNPRIRYIATSPSESRCNWDRGYREARGEYLLWLDDDNYLLPHALTTLARAINKTHADIVTGDHVHWYEATHPRRDLRNFLALPFPLFGHAIQKVDPKNYVRALFGMPKVGTGSRARFHFSETAIKKSRIDALMPMIGTIDFSATSPRMLQLVLLASTPNVVHIDSPICIVIQMGDSMAYRWADSMAREKRFATIYTRSPVTANTYINYVVENLLRAQELFPRDLAEFSVRWNLFFRTYARELSLLDAPLRTVVPAWRELAHAMAMKDVPVPPLFVFRRALRTFTIKALRQAHLYGYLVRARRSTVPSAKNTRVVRLGSRVRSISDCARELPAAVEKELGIPYDDFIGVRSANP